METGATAVVGRGLVEILPDFRKFGKQLVSDMKLASGQFKSSFAPIEGSYRDSMGRLRDANGRFITDIENGWKAGFKTIGASMAKVGKGVGAIGIGVAAVSVKMAADFQSETAVLQTAAGETAKGLKTVRKGIMDISTNTGTGIKNLTDGMYLIEKAGFRGADGLKVLKAAAQGAREENAKLSDVTNAMTSVMASYHLKADKSVQVMNAMKTAAGEGKITMEEFSGALSTVLPIASANKISFEQVAGAVATLTQHGTSAREATHELGATIRALASPNMVAQREMARFGLDSVDVSQKIGKRGLTGTFELLTNTILSKMGPSGKILLSAFEGTKQSAQDAQIMISKLPPELQKQAKAFAAGTIELDDWKAVVKGSTTVQQPMLRNLTTLVNRSRGFSRELKSGGPSAKTYTDALKKMSGGAIGLNTILQLTGESTAGFKDRVDKVGKSFHNGSKDVEGWKITQGLLNVQLARAKQSVQVLMIEIGTKLIPVLSAMVSWLVKNKDVALALVIAIGALAAALTAAYVISKVYAVVTGVMTAAQWAYNAAVTEGGAALLLLRVQLIALSIQEKVVAVWTAVASSAFWGLAAAILANPITWIVVAIVALVAGIYLLATRTKFFQTVWKATWGFVKTVFTGFVHWFKANWQLITFTIMTLGIGLAVAMIVRHWKAVKQAFIDSFNWVKSHWPLLLAIITGPIGMAVFLIVKYWKQISGGAETAYHATVDWFVRMGKDIGGFFAKLPGIIGGFFTQTLPGALSSMWKSISDWFTKLPGRIWSLLKSANTGVGQANDAMLSMGENLIKGLWKGAGDFFTKSVPDFFKMLWHGIVDYFKAVFGIHSPSTVMADLGIQLIQGLFVGMLKIAATIGTWLNTYIASPVVNFFKSAGSWLVQHGRDLINGLVSGAKQWWNNESSWWTSRGKTIVAWFAAAGSWLVQHGRDLINGLTNGAKQWWANETSWWTGRGKAIIGYFGAAGSWLVSHGKQIIGGLYSGFTEQWKTVIGWVRSLKDKVVSAVVSVFKIGSPAKTMIPLGIHIMAGLMKGMLSSKGALKTVVKSIFHSASDVLKRGGNLLGDLVSNLGGSIGLGTPGAKTSAEQFAQTFIKAKYGWAGPQWAALYNLWMGESGWNPGALNKSSGAYGIPQSLPASKMASAGSDWRTNAATQIKWGTNYIKSVYGNPVNAYSKWLARKPHWYDAGGIARGVGAIFKNTNQPERVLSPRQTTAFEHLVGALTTRPLTAGGGGTTVIHATFENHGVIGSQHELENWFVRTTDTLKRKGRIK